MIATQPLKWHGGKHYLAKRIVAMMPPHDRYLEAFAGGLSVLFAKPCEGIAEFANDTNGELVNFWRVMSNEFHFNRLQRWLQFTPLSEEVFEDVAGGEPFVAPKGAQSCELKALWFFIRLRQSRQGLGKDYCTPTSRTRRGMNEQVSAWLSAIDGLPEVHERLRRVEVWNRPATKAIKRLDSPTTLVYADPPYVHSTRSTVGEHGGCEMTDADHVELLHTLASMRGRFLLSGYQCELYDEFASQQGWKRVDFDVPNNASGAKVKQRKTESIWANFDIAS